MVDGWTVATSLVGALGAIGSIYGTVSAVRASSARRYAERGVNAAALLAAVDQTEGRKFVSDDNTAKLQLELSRVVRESAAVYATQYPTPAGFEGMRMLSAAYAFVFGIFGVVLVVTAFFDADTSRRLASFVGGLGCLLFALLCGAVVVTLMGRLSRRNTARELSDTPGQERYFDSIHEMVAMRHHRRATRSRRRSSR